MRCITRTLAADHVTPVRAYAALRAHAAGTSSFLLESVVPGERWGRYSIVGYRPRHESNHAGSDDALASLGAEMLQVPEVDGLAARFSQALIGYIAFDAVHLAHKVPAWPEQGDLVRTMRDCTVIVFDNLRQTLTIAGRSEDDVEQCASDMAHGPELRPMTPPDPAAAPADLEISMDDFVYGQKVERAKEYIRAGDAFQIVLARTFTTPQNGADLFDVYRALRVLSPSPYLYFLDFAGSSTAEPLSVAGASPETMVRVEGNTMTLRPIAGTRPRGKSAEEDAALATELLADPKERAEHVMLIDLARNDLGRVCSPGTIGLTANMEVERYSHVMHIVSSVRGQIRPDRDAAALLRATFPAGTVSGAPKVRAMQIISELEGRRRGGYAGAVGYLGFGGDMDTCIAIRTVVMRDGVAYLQAGAGVVADSDPAAEYEECMNKVAALGVAIDQAETGTYGR